MKKSLVALAVLAASGASFAQSSVTLYGVADIWFGSAELKGGDRTTVLESGGVSGSRWGMKGTEDLGGGLKANFLLEQGISLDSGAVGAGFNRQAYVGLSGGFGEVKLGNVYTAYDDISGAANSAFDSALAPQNNVWASTGYTSNPSNNIYYASPEFAGFSGAVSYSLNEKTALKTEATSLHVKYNGGPLYVGLGYQSDEVYNTGVSTDYLRLNGTYDFGAAKLLVGFGSVDYAIAADVKEWELGVDVPLSASLTLSGGVAVSKPDGGSKSTGYAVAAAYSMSKRTTLYTGFHSSSTDNTAANDNKIFAVGVKHTF
jgi:predicted porin